MNPRTVRWTWALLAILGVLAGVGRAYAQTLG